MKEMRPVQRRQFFKNVWYDMGCSSGVAITFNAQLPTFNIDLEIVMALNYKFKTKNTSPQPSPQSGEGEVQHAAKVQIPNE